MLEFKLKKGILVHDLNLGDHVTCDSIIVNFTGRRGLLAIDFLEDIIMRRVIEAKELFGEDNPKNKENALVEEKEKPVSKASKVSMVEGLGIVHDINKRILEYLEQFATINSKKLSYDLQEQIDIEDLSLLCKAVVNHFLEPRLASMQKNTQK